MKKMNMVVAAAAVLLLTASSAMAAALGPHQGPGTNPCKVCHDTAAGTPALRGWAGAGSGPATGWGAKSISGLCYKCHDSVGGTFGPGHNMLSNAYDNVSHGYTVTDMPQASEGSAQTGMSTSGLPYVTTAELECTSCHNVHVSTSRPFNQRASYQAMCNACHAGRANNASATTEPGTLHAYSTHPTAQTLLADTARANLKLVGAIAPNLRVGTPAAPNYALGGHLNDAGGTTGSIDCQTCHAVHGPTQDTPGRNDQLAIENATGAGGNALCEGCHFGGLAGEQVGSVVAYLQAGLPAGEYSDHPIDNLVNGSFYPTGNAIPANWMLATPNLDRGAQPYFAGITPACSSCHDTHGGLENTPLLRGPQPVAGFGAMNYNDWCFACHTYTQIIPDNHHSVVGNLATSSLDCGDCHGAAGTTNMNAHNGFFSFAVPISATNSSFCEGCHIADNPTTFVAGGLKGGQTYTAATLPARHGVIRDVNTAPHNNTHQTNEVVNGTNINMDITPDWVTAVPVNTAALGYVSQWGGAGSNVPICESCHNILRNGVETARALTAGWEANLLLAPYEDDNVGTGTGENNDFYGNTTRGAGATGSNMCRACHRGQGATSIDFVHNPGAHTWTSAGAAAPYSNYAYAANTNPYGRSSALVSTDITATCATSRTTADAAGAPGGLSYPALNEVDCDSCHRPHNADADSLDAATNRHLILEITDANWGTTICAQCHDTDVQCN